MIKEVAKLIQGALKSNKIKLSLEEIEILIEIPPSHEMGDYSFPCFSLASKLKQNPHEVALMIREKIGTEPATDFDDIQTQGPYVNFFLDRKNMARKIVWDAITFKEKFGMGDIGKKKKVIVEFSSPNIAKPFGIGHLRSTIIGNSISNLYDFQGYKTIRMNYLGDWGTQFGKLIYGYKKYGDDDKLKKDPIKHLLDIYVRVNKDKKNEKKAREEFKKMEEGDRGNLILWKMFKGFSLKDFEEIYKRLGIKFDALIGESDYNKKMPQVIKELENKKLLKTSQGARIVNLKEHDLGVCLIQKTDGATLYATRDITSAISRYKKYKFDQIIYEVGQEQTLYFKQFFKVLELMGYEWSKNCIHVGHGHYLDSDGKRFATRKGKTVFMEEILDKTVSLAEKEIKKRESKIKKEDLRKKANKIAIASIFYGDLKNNRSNNVIFDLKKFVSFEGDTGPYLLYSYARATSILNKSTNKDKFEVPELNPKELELVKKLSLFPDIAFKAYESLNPSLVANYAYQLSKLFNEFYHSCPVIGSEEESFRLALIEAFRQVLKNSLNLLGISTLERM